MTTAAGYSFLPWLRTGLASAITRPDGILTGAPRAEVAVTVVIDAAGDERAVTAPLTLFGPGEVAALDPRAVMRTVPRPGELDAEPTVLSMVEFAEADLPWRFTPASADGQGRLRTWLVLAVLAAGEIVDEAAAGPDGRLAAITVGSAEALPRLDQSWAWAHVQVDGFDPATETLAGVTATRLRSRLLAARRLTPRTDYTAVLVPAFERGRLAGLREPLAETVDGLAPAWLPTATGVRLPVYHRWSFRTGEQAGFEQLARRLTARVAGPTVGLSAMDVTSPDPALPAASGTPLDLAGALVAPAAVARDWPAGERAAFTAAVAALLNQPADAIEHGDAQPIVAPPLWGRWQAARDRLDPEPAASPQWFHELNADPRLRAAAGLGAEVVRRNDEQLMAAAWNQVEGVLAANEQLRRAQLAREASVKLLTRHLSTMDTDTFLRVTAPVQSRLVAPTPPPAHREAATPVAVTVAHRLRTSPIPHGALDGRLRRIRRAAPAVTAPGPGAAGGLLDRLNRREVRSRPPVPTPKGMLVAGLTVDRVVVGSTGETDVDVAWAEATRGDAGRGEAARTIPRAPASAAWLPAVAGGLYTGGVGHKPVPIGATRDNPAVARAVELFRDAFVDLVEHTGTALQAGPVLHQADLPALAAGLLSGLDPRVSIADGIRHRLTIAPWVRWQDPDPLEAVLVAPEFDTPMYEPLRDLGHDWLLPGAGTIPPDTMTLVVSDQRFIEAYLAGLSHEMGRELLYHEYPTDQRGTYFRQFWDVRGCVGADGTAADAQALHDIRPIHRWRADAGIGANTGRVPPPPPDQLVVLIRGELLRRYPATLVSAVAAIIGGDGRRTLGDTVTHPIFSGRLEPDIAFFGFDLTPGQARGTTGTDQGWFFVLAEHPAQPLFGLDADNGDYGGRPASWNDLNWAHLAADAAALAELSYLDLDADLPDTTAVLAAPGDPALAWHAGHGLGPTGANGSDLAWITLQRPFRVAIHGVDMLPEVAP